MCTNWATSDTITEGIPNIDMRYNYTNHFDVFADVVGIFKSSIFMSPEATTMWAEPYQPRGTTR